MKTTNIFETNIDCLIKDDFLRELKLSKRALKVVKINSEFLLRAKKNEEFREVLNNADLRMADGVGVLWAAKYLSLSLKAKKLRITNFKLLITIEAVWQLIYSGASLVFYPRYCQNPIPEAFRGTDAMKLMLKLAEEEKMPVFLFGSSSETLEKAIRNIKEEFKEIKISGSRNGYDFIDEEVIKNINDSGAVMLFVALGSPQQEYWIEKNFESLKNVRIAVGEGGSFEFIAGTFRRAPKWMRFIGLEWLWRLFANKSLTPTGGSRVKRVWDAVPVFILEVVKYKLKKS